MLGKSKEKRERQDEASCPLKVMEMYASTSGAYRLDPMGAVYATGLRIRT
jgi:hypothetical protein